MITMTIYMQCGADIGDKKDKACPSAERIAAAKQFTNAMPS
jgi:hypothetical protein